MTKKLWVDYKTGCNLPNTAMCNVTAMRKQLECKLLPDDYPYQYNTRFLLWVIPTDRYDSVVAALTLYGVNTEVYDE